MAATWPLPCRRSSRSVTVDTSQPTFRLQLHQPGQLRPLDASELSDGTLRYLLLAAALFSPRLPPLLVLNEPENSLHPDLLVPLARLIAAVAERTQVWVVRPRRGPDHRPGGQPRLHSAAAGAGAWGDAVARPDGAGAGRLALAGLIAPPPQGHGRLRWAGRGSCRFSLFPAIP
jgi:hypothetical protein